MRKIVSGLFMSLDGVVEAPERWVRFNDELGAEIDAQMAAADTLLLGRRTYQVFAASWPQRSMADDPGADWMNSTPKLVASTTLDTVTWANSTLLKGDVLDAVAEHKQRDGRDIMISGSPTLVRSLLRAGLLDELRLFVNPVVLGSGARLFGDDRFDLDLTSARKLDTGVLSLVYRPGTDG